MKERLEFIGVYNGFALYVDLEDFPTPTQTTRASTSGAGIPTEQEDAHDHGADSPRD